MSLASSCEMSDSLDLYKECIWNNPRREYHSLERSHLNDRCNLWQQVQFLKGHEPKGKEESAMPDLPTLKNHNKFQRRNDTGETQKRK